MTVDFSKGLKCTLGCKKLPAALNITVELQSHRGTPIEKQRHKPFHFIIYRTASSITADQLYYRMIQIQETTACMLQ